ncbi:MAG TPA: TetR/AcrR family transcriptional regulator [Acidimicrobiales bacterium]|nr:TetR/AcrR family transcriptional regulator [Acidimicrobiales bacterium]
MPTEVNTPAESPEGSSSPSGYCPLGSILRPLRADARRNRAKVLEAAAEVFATEGLAVPIDEVARRAGVGVGTVYRHFPTKEALIEAIVLDRVEALVERAEELSRSDDPGEAMFTFISELVQLAVSKKDMTDELARTGVESEQLVASVKERLERAFDVLLQRAQDAGVVRHDINRTDATALVMGCCMAASQQGCRDAAPRLIAVLCDGFRAPAPSPSSA